MNAAAAENHCIPGDAARVYAGAIRVDPSIEWQMQPGEQTALIALLDGLNPEVAIEIGSRDGGSLQVLSRYAQRVISLDIDPTCSQRLGPRFPNTEFITGPSQQTFRELVARLDQEDSELGFVLIDGDHSAAGVKADIECLLDYRPRCPLFVVMHDSFNPDVRRGIRGARWSENHHVHSVELDYLPGVLASGGDAHREMWGGFALAILLPQPRSHELKLSARMEHLFQVVLRGSAHWWLDPRMLARRCARKVNHLLAIT